MDKTKHIKNNGKWAKCQRNNYQVKTVGDLKQLALQPTPSDHQENQQCICVVCENMKANNCDHSAKCRADDRHTLSALLPKWNLSTPRNNDILSELNPTSSPPTADRENQEIEYSAYFNPNINLTSEPLNEI